MSDTVYTGYYIGKYHNILYRLLLKNNKFILNLPPIFVENEVIYIDFRNKTFSYSMYSKKDIMFSAENRIYKFKKIYDKLVHIK